MSAFPSLTELLLPNLNIFTVIGVVVLVVGILSFWLQPALTSMFGAKSLLVSFGAILTGIILIWGVSIFQDFIGTLAGALIFWLSIFVLILATIMFYEPKSKPKRRKSR